MYAMTCDRTYFTLFIEISLCHTAPLPMFAMGFPHVLLTLPAFTLLLCNGSILQPAGESVLNQGSGDLFCRFAVPSHALAHGSVHLQGRVNSPVLLMR